MARFLIATVPITGHVQPGLPIARALIERGHEVRKIIHRHADPLFEKTAPTAVLQARK